MTEAKSNSMEDDLTPRLAPTPKPVSLEVSTSKVIGPEVTLLFDGDDSCTWQELGHSVKLHKSQTFQTNHSTRIAFSTDSPYGIQPQVTKQVGVVTSASTSIKSPLVIRSQPSPFPSYPVTSATDRASSYADIPKAAGQSVDVFSNAKQYNPQVYSPVPKHGLAAQYASLYSHQKGNHCTKQDNSNNQQFTSPVTYSTPSQSTALCFTTDPLHDANTPSVAQQISKPPVTQGGYPHPQNVGVTKGHSYIKNISTVNKENINPSSSPCNQMTTLPARLESHAVLAPHLWQSKQNTKYHTPLNQGLQTVSAAQLQQSELNTRYHTPRNQGLQIIEPVCHKVNTGENNVSRVPDPLIYQLIDQQNQQIINLSNILSQLMEKQEKANMIAPSGEKQSDKVVHTRGVHEKTVVYRDVAIQTEFSDLIETCSAEVNTDISWPELIASVKNGELLDNNVNGVQNFSGKVTDNSAGIHKEIPYRGTPTNNMYSKECFKKCGATPHYRLHSLESKSDSLEEREASVCQDINVTSQQVFVERHAHSPSPTHMPASVENAAPNEFNTHSRNSEDESEKQSSLLLGDSAASYPHDHTATSTSSPVGFTFYNNVMTNIQQILQNSDRGQEEPQQRQEQQQVKSQHIPQIVQREESQEDPTVEAMRRQLLQFGISFIDPTTLTNKHQPVVDSMYLPGYHNMVSLYQSAVSTHCHPDTISAKYLTDSQLAAIAEKSPVMAVNEVARRIGCSPTQEPTTSQDTGHLFRVTLSNNFSITTEQFLDKYGLKGD